MTVKDQLCEGCCLFDCKGPVESEIDDLAEVLFVGEAPGAIEIDQNRPMVGQAGQVLRHTLAFLGQSCEPLQHVGIANVYRCRPPGNVLPDDAAPGEYCKRHLQEDLARNSYKVIIPWLKKNLKLPKRKIVQNPAFLNIFN